MTVRRIVLTDSEEDAKSCTHLDQAHHQAEVHVTEQDHLLGFDVRSVVCEECAKENGWWVHLRQCMTCGHIGCCNSSPKKHAAAHAHEHSHPIIRSIELHETWGWCYTDQMELDFTDPDRPVVPQFQMV